MSHPPISAPLPSPPGRRRAERESRAPHRLRRRYGRPARTRMRGAWSDERRRTTRALPVHRQLGPQHHGRVSDEPARFGALPRSQRGQPSDRKRPPHRSGAARGARPRDGRTAQPELGRVRGGRRPRIEFVFTVCDNAAGETCPVWPGHPITAHWGIEDPAAASGSPEDRRHAFERAYGELEERIVAFLALRLDSLDGRGLQHALDAIGLQSRTGETR